MIRARTRESHRFRTGRAAAEAYATARCRLLARLARDRERPRAAA